jgi:hypothetical protein
MNQQKIKTALAAMQQAFDYILYNVKPGTPGKVDAMYELHHAMRELPYSLPEDVRREQEAA